MSDNLKLNLTNLLRYLPLHLELYAVEFNTSTRGKIYKCGKDENILLNIYNVPSLIVASSRQC